MTTYYHIHPEVAGELGAETEHDGSSLPPTQESIQKLHYEFSGWLGDELLKSYSCYIITDSVKNHLDGSELSGWEINDVQVTTSVQFQELHPDRDLPTFHWLKITGEPGEDDFGIAENNRLVISESALSVLQEVTIDNAEVDEWG
ncbi:hypothetical protein [Halovivax cerinus]|uniref:Uncharacterized protein n=1 Tax=Halovivax cerinus TaxID=1487865 RepID=A0ABD5NTY7_9EURY|nr:hypothetical protein [Halovivax cerinus]